MSAPFALKVSDSDQYRIAFNGVTLSLGAGQTGLADGQFLTAKTVDVLFGRHVGTDGLVTRAKKNNRLVEIHLKFGQSSSNNAVLSTIAANDENQPNGAGVGSFILEDLQGTTFLSCTSSWIEGYPEIDLDRDPTERDWTIIGIYDIFLAGGN